MRSGQGSTSEVARLQTSSPASREECIRCQVHTLSSFGDQYAELDWQRLALTRGQVERYAIPAREKPDRRYKPARVQEAFETEALSQTVVVALVREHLDQLLPEPIDTVRLRELEQRIRLSHLLDELTL